MTRTAIRFADAMNKGVDVLPKTIPAWIAKKMGDPQVLLFESQRALARERTRIRKEKMGSSGGKRGRPRTRMSDEDRARLNKTIQEYRDAVK